MTLYIDAGWILEIQASKVPKDPSLRDWGALHAAVERHRFERFAGETYYEEAATRAAVLLETIVRLKPFDDFNGTIGATCAWAYLGQAGEPITPPPGAMVQLVGDVRGGKLGLAAIARRLRDWKA